MKLKDWINTQLPTNEIVMGASYTPRGDNPVEHPIGVFPCELDDSVIYNNKNINSKLCYHNINNWCYRGTKKRRMVINRLRPFEHFMTKEGCSVGERIPIEQYMKSMVEHKFVVSPEGNGIDCHRHYEAILTKGIPIVQYPAEHQVKRRWNTPSYMEKYEDLPVLWTDNYRRLHQKYLEEMYLEMLETEYNFEKMKLSYWMQKTPEIKQRMIYWRKFHNLSDLNFPEPSKSVELKPKYIEPEKIDPNVKIQDKPLRRVKRIAKSHTNDADTLVCINFCESDLKHLNEFKKTILYKKLHQFPTIGLLEYMRGSEDAKFKNGRLHLPGDERYDKLHVKTYDMIKWCIEHLKFNQLVKLDCNFMSYNHVGERTREQICGMDKVDKLIFKRRRMPYDGTSGRVFKTNDFKEYSKRKHIDLKIDLPEWVGLKPWYYCGKAYKISYDFAKFVATSEVCENIVAQHNVLDDAGYYPLAVEDVMIGRMYELYEKTLA